MLLNLEMELSTSCKHSEHPFTIVIIRWASLCIRSEAFIFSMVKSRRERNDATSFAKERKFVVDIQASYTLRARDAVTSLATRINQCKCYIDKRQSNAGNGKALRILFVTVTY